MYLRLIRHESSGTLSWQGTAMDAWLRRGPAADEVADKLAPAAAPISNMAAPASRARPCTCAGSQGAIHQRAFRLGKCRVWKYTIIGTSNMALMYLQAVLNLGLTCRSTHSMRIRHNSMLI